MPYDPRRMVSRHGQVSKWHASVERQDVSEADGGLIIRHGHVSMLLSFWLLAYSSFLLEHCFLDDQCHCCQTGRFPGVRTESSSCVRNMLSGKGVATESYTKRPCGPPHFHLPGISSWEPNDKNSNNIPFSFHLYTHVQDLVGMASMPHHIISISPMHLW